MILTRGTDLHRLCYLAHALLRSSPMLPCPFLCSVTRSTRLLCPRILLFVCEDKQRVGVRSRLPQLVMSKRCVATPRRVRQYILERPHASHGLENRYFPNAHPRPRLPFDHAHTPRNF
jgi:hypothetical protein